MNLQDIYFNLQADIQEIELELEKTIQSENAILTDAAVHLLKAGGKRIRPVFVLLSGMFGKYTIDDILNVAVPLELIHMASLVHDDVIDDANIRRGKKTIKANWDNKVAMYCGDFIFSKALERMAMVKNNEAHQVLSKAIVEMCVGEIEQIRDHDNTNVSFRDYLRRIKRKTALLIAVSCKLGGIATGATKQQYQSLFRYGYFVGMSFQISDDILDFVGTNEQLGKPAGGDLREGNITLPALYALESNEVLRNHIDQMLLKEEKTDEDVQTAIEMIRQSGGIEYSKALSNRYLNKAYAELEKLPNINAKQSLIEIASFVGSRKY
jgi:heptaprenyl diphosphate synthase